MHARALTAFALAMLALPISARAAWHDKYGATSYRGTPNLRLTLSMVIAGGGPKAFDSVKLIKTMSGPHFGPMVARLTKRYGSKGVGQFVKTFNFAVDETLADVQHAHVALPATPAPPPTNGPLLASALYNAGVMPSGQFDVGYMLEHLISHPLHMQVMHQIDGASAYGPTVNAQWHEILTDALHDIHTGYVEDRGVKVARLERAGRLERTVRRAGDATSPHREPAAARAKSHVRLVVTHVDDDPGVAGDPHFTYGGTWQHVQHKNDGRSNGTSSRSDTKGSWVDLQFTGVAVALYGVSGKGGGYGAVFLDGRQQREMADFFAAKKDVGVLVFHTELMLPQRKHVLRVVVSGQKRPESEGTYVNVDEAVVVSTRPATA